MAAAVNAVTIVALLASSASVLAAVSIPTLRPFLNYGKTWSSGTSGGGLIGALSSVSVPHSWFWHFYCLLITIEALTYDFRKADLRAVLLALQGIRRLAEQLFLMPHSPSRMHVSHYLVGLIFYTLEPLATVPSRKNGRLFSVLLFGIGSVFQFGCHRSLANTKKYRFPKFPITSLHERLETACPHYGAEIIIYLAFVCLADPAHLGGFCVTLTTLVWVIVSLGVSGQRSRKHYENAALNHRGADPANRRELYIKWAILPYFY